jgi:hypothetical protein
MALPAVTSHKEYGYCENQEYTAEMRECDFRNKVIKDTAASFLFSLETLILVEASCHVRRFKQPHGEVP